MTRDCECSDCYMAIHLLMKIDYKLFDNIGVYCKSCHSIIYAKH